MQGLGENKSVFESFANAYDIRTIDSSVLLKDKTVPHNLILSEYSLNVASARSKYEYPNYNNICLMVNYLVDGARKRINSSKYIYAGRKKDTSYGRELENENELIESLVKLGFEILYPEEFSFQEQISIFSNARIVIGVSGSALLTGVYCQNPSDIIELCPDTDFRPGVWLNSIISKSNYHLFLGPSLDGKTIHLKPEKFKINIHPVLETIKNIINSKSQKDR